MRGVVAQCCVVSSKAHELAVANMPANETTKGHCACSLSQNSTCSFVRTHERTASSRYAAQVCSKEVSYERACHPHSPEYLLKRTVSMSMTSFTPAMLAALMPRACSLRTLGTTKLSFRNSAAQTQHTTQKQHAYRCNLEHMRLLT